MRKKSNRRVRWMRGLVYLHVELGWAKEVERCELALVLVYPWVYSSKNNVNKFDIAYMDCSALFFYFWFLHVLLFERQLDRF